MEYSGARVGKPMNMFPGSKWACLMLKIMREAVWPLGPTWKQSRPSLMNRAWSLGAQEQTGYWISLSSHVHNIYFCHVLCRLWEWVAWVPWDVPSYSLQCVFSYLFTLLRCCNLAPGSLSSCLGFVVWVITWIDVSVRGLHIKNYSLTTWLMLFHLLFSTLKHSKAKLTL